MTFDANQPNASQSPGAFPSAGNTNFSRLKTLINAEHVFNDTAAADDGCHRQMTLVSRADPVSLPAGTNAMLYSKNVSGLAQLFFYDGSTITPVISSATLSIEARIVFNNAGTALGTPYNCTVAPAGSGTYNITFTTPLSSLNLPYSLMGYDSSSNIVVGKIVSYSVNVMQVRFKNQNNTTLTSFTRGSLIIFGA